MKELENQLIKLEKELNLIPRRQLNLKIDCIQSDIKHAIQMAKSHSYTGQEKKAHLFWQCQLEGMQRKWNS